MAFFGRHAARSAEAPDAVVGTDFGSGELGTGDFRIDGRSLAIEMDGPTVRPQGAFEILLARLARLLEPRERAESGTTEATAFAPDAAPGAGTTGDDTQAGGVLSDISLVDLADSDDANQGGASANGGGAAGAVVGALTGGSYFAWLADQNNALPTVPPATPSFSADDFSGTGQTIVVIDDGYSNVYDQSATVFEFDFAGFTGDGSAETQGTNSHGSWVAQTALGVAPEADIIHLKVFADDGASASALDIQQALDWVVANGEAYDVAAVNVSLGFGNATQETTTLFSDELAVLDELGIFTVVAAGNDAQTYPDGGVNVIAADPNAIAVSAVDDDGELASFSQEHPELTDVAAPGVGIPVTTLSGQTGTVNGTSFSAPYVAGTAALLQEASETINGERLTDEEFLEILTLAGSAPDGASPGADYAVADADAALDFFIANAALYDDDPLIA